MTFSTSERQKKLKTQFCLTLLTSKCASHHNGVHFFDIRTSKSGPFDFQMCFVPERRARFLTSQLPKVVREWCVLAFWLRNVLRATTVCTFSTSELPNVVRESCVLYILACKCASHHNGVHFFDITTSKSGLRMVCFVHFGFEMCFAPQRRAIFNLTFDHMAPHPPL